MRSRFFTFVVLVSLLPFLTGATIVIRGPRAPAAATPAMIANASAGGENGATTSAIDTTGANFAVLVISYYHAGGAITVSDSKGNTWTARTAYTGATHPGARLYYTQGGTFGTSHTFTIAGTGIYASFSVLTFSNISGSPYDVENGSVKGTTWTTRQGGSFTPSQANTVSVVGLGFGDNSSGAISINDSYTIPANGTIAYNASYYGASIAYKILTSATAQNPTWTSANLSNEAAIAGASFKY